MDPEARSQIWELVVVTAALIIITHVLYIFRHIAWIGHSISTVVAILFIYTPVLVLWKRHRPIDFLDRHWRSFFIACLFFLAAALIIFPPFLLLAHFWQIIIMGKQGFKAAGLPNIMNVILFQLLLVALPEEFFFRGYFQSTIDKILKGRKRILGVDVGAGFLITAAVFAVAHTMVTYQWWHFSIFFPALLFGYLRLRTGSITAPILFHTASNVLMDWFSRSYW